tara:strand:+ start:232 stop:369 length:138 start_codon:yes stop_codon:yes gene_type:complete
MDKKNLRILLLEILGPIKQWFAITMLRLMGYKNIHPSIVLRETLK